MGLEQLEQAIADWLPSNMATQARLRKCLGRKSGLLGTSSKIDKEDKAKVSTKVLYLAPYKLSGVNVCPQAKHCIATCLNTAGRGAFNSTQLARINKTKQLIADPYSFCELLWLEIVDHARKCEAQGVIPAIRLNGTSDICWGPLWAACSALGVRCYEYTKRTDPKFMCAAVAAGVTIAHSYQGTDSVQQLATIGKRGYPPRLGNVAVVFAVAKGEPLPAVHCGMHVIDGDLTDNRFNDPQGVVVGLRAKGEARFGHKSPFIVRIEH